MGVMQVKYKYDMLKNIDTITRNHPTSKKWYFTGHSNLNQKSRNDLTRILMQKGFKTVKWELESDDWPNCHCSWNVVVKK